MHEQLQIHNSSCTSLWLQDSIYAVREISGSTLCRAERVGLSALRTTLLFLLAILAQVPKLLQVC